MDGILNLNKPKGLTSHDVVNRVRRLTQVRRVGHAGTLDPMATGVLLVCLGRATRISEYLMSGRKRYRAVIRLGISTDSHDADGQVTATSPVQVERLAVEQALSQFNGAIDQIPPMVSAIKQDGQPLYKLARRGLAVERAPRQVEIFQIALTDWQPPSLTVELACSPGTYVRALARDLGRQLGCGAHLTALVRLSSGDFTLTDALELEQFALAIEQEEKAQTKPSTGPTETKNRLLAWHALVLPMDAGLQHLPAWTLNEPDSRRVQIGQSLPAESVAAPHDKLCRVYAGHNSEKRMLALLRFDHDAQLWRPHKVFFPL